MVVCVGMWVPRLCFCGLIGEGLRVWVCVFLCFCELVGEWLCVWVRGLLCFGGLVGE